jgi:pimeloyl-ACP methyl ester carboxylesterase
MVTDLIQKLSISKPIYILGVSQGGFIGARMALLNPDIVQGLILISSSMYADTEETEKMGCPNIRKILEPWLKLISDKDHDNNPNIDFQVPSSFTDSLMKSLLDDHVPSETREFWLKVCIVIGTTSCIDTFFILKTILECQRHYTKMEHELCSISL